MLIAANFFRIDFFLKNITNMKCLDVVDYFYQYGGSRSRYTKRYLFLPFLIFIILLITTLSLVKPIQYVMRKRWLDSPDFIEQNDTWRIYNNSYYCFEARNALPYEITLLSIGFILAPMKKQSYETLHAMIFYMLWYAGLKISVAFIDMLWYVWCYETFGWWYDTQKNDMRQEKMLWYCF